MATIRQVLKEMMARNVGEDGQPLSANQLSKDSGIPQSTVTRILSGKSTNVRTHVILGLAKHFELTEAQMSGHAPLPDHRLAAPNKEERPGYLTYVTVEEMELLTHYRSVNPEGMKAINAMLVAISEKAPRTVDGQVHQIRRREG